MKKTLFLVLALMMAISTSAFAMDFNEDANSDQYLVKAPAMMVRGIHQVVLAPMDLVYHIYDGTANDTPILGTLKGTGEGLMQSVDFLGRGALDLVGSLIPGMHGAPSHHKVELLR